MTHIRQFLTLVGLTLVGLSVPLLAGCSGSGDEDSSPTPVAAAPSPRETPESTPSVPAETVPPTPADSLTNPPESTSPTPTATPYPAFELDCSASPPPAQEKAPKSAPQSCDPQDCNCDGQLELDFSDKYYPDLDGDGFGAGEYWVCDEAEGLIANHSDCDDQDNTRFPGAPDASGDGVDSSCDGEDGLAPSVGLDTSTFSSIQAALDAASDGQTLWIGPGTYIETDLSMYGKTLTVRAATGSSQTILDAQGAGRIWRFDQGETPESVLEGFELRGGLASDLGGAIRISDSSPTLRGCIFRNNQVQGAGALGGALALERSSAVLERLLFQKNGAGSCTSTSTSNTSSSENEYGSGTTETSQTQTTCLEGLGGAMALLDSTPETFGLELKGNQATGSGGAVYAKGSTLELTDARISSNRALSVCTETRTITDTYWQEITGYAESSSNTAHTLQCAASARGGAIFAEGTELYLTANTYLDNAAPSTCVSLQNAHSQSPCSMGIECYNNKTTYSCNPGTGGTVYVDGGHLQSQLEHYETSRATLGGAFFLRDTTLELKRARIVDAAATAGIGSSSSSDGSFGSSSAPVVVGGQGGALYLLGGSSRLQEVVLDETTASVSGGGIYSEAGEVTLCGLRAQEAQAAGVLGTTSSMNSDRSSWTSYTSWQGGTGGGIHSASGTLNVQNSVLEGNHARQGGAIFSSSSTTLANVLLNGNYADGTSTKSIKYTSAGDVQSETTTLLGGRGAGLYHAGGILNALYSVFSGNEAQDMIQEGSASSLGLGGGIYVTQAGSDTTHLLVLNSIVSHNHGVGLYAEKGSVTFQYSALSAPADQTPSNLTSLDATVLTGDPGFLEIDELGLPVDFHLALDSMCRDSGVPDALDIDGSRADMGLYGGSAGDGLDRDQDGVPDYFWPGTWADAPAGFSPLDYDCDDENPSLQACL